MRDRINRYIKRADPNVPYDPMRFTNDEAVARVLNARKGQITRNDNISLNRKN